jgi:hypothetical protein
MERGMEGGGGRGGGGASEGGRQAGTIVMCNHLFHEWCMDTFRWNESRMLPTICQCMA